MCEEDKEEGCEKMKAWRGGLQSAGVISSNLAISNALNLLSLCPVWRFK